MPLDFVLRKWFPKRYCYRKLKQTKDEYKVKLKAARSLPRMQQEELKSDLDIELDQLYLWKEEIEDAELVAKAQKMDVYLDEIPPSPSDEPRMFGEGTPEVGDDDYEPPAHYTVTGYGYRVLRPATRAALVKKVRERTPTFRKEQREVRELYIRLLIVVTGLLGTATGLVLAFLKK